MRRPAPDTLDRMATQGRRPARRTGGTTPARRGKAGAAQKPATKSRTKAQDKVVFDAPRSTPEEPRTFRLGAVPGATPGRWIDAWKQRMPHVRLELIPISAAEQRTALVDLDAALVRLPLVDPTLHIIPLYDEVPVVVAGTDSHLLSVDELSSTDLAGEVVIVPDDDVLGPLEVPGAVSPNFPALRTTADAIATAASGAGIVIVPMSLARLHHRKDADYRPLIDGPSSTVALVWPRDRTTDDVETFVGIVRGRTANSSR
jgi:DNA-binding transcriptional LysR family regulator